MSAAGMGFGALLITVKRASCHPGWGVPEAFELFVAREKRKETFTVVRSRWERAHDTRLLEDAEREQQPKRRTPTIARAHLAVDARIGRQIRKAIESLSLPLTVAAPMYGMDGTMIGVVFGEQFASCEFHWWVEAPEEWKGLGLVADEVVKLAARAVFIGEQLEL